MEYSARAVPDPERKLQKGLEDGGDADSNHAKAGTNPMRGNFKSL